MTRLLLFPGAGSRPAPLVSLRGHRARPWRRCACVRADFPYRKAGRKAPDRAPVLLQAVRDEAAAAAAPSPAWCSAAGRWAGGCARWPSATRRIRCRAVGLVLICYPLHPPGKPERLRVEHFPRLTVPCLFVSGTKDTFGTPDELQHWTATIPGPVTHVWIEGKGHDLKGADDQIAAAVADWLAAAELVTTS